MLKVSLHKSFKALLITGLFSLSYGCTTLTSPPNKRDTLPELSLGGATQSSYSDDSALDLSNNKATKTTGLNGELIFYLLSAELAGQRNNLDYALEVYSALAFKTQHPLIAERTSWIAQFAQQPKAALDAAILWAMLAPESPDAQRTAAGLLLQNEQYLNAFEHLLKFEALSSESNYTLLANHLAEKNNPVISILYQRMLKEQQQRAEASSDLETALALLSNSLGDQLATQTHLKAALAANSNNIRALQLKAQLLTAAGNFEEAEQLLC